MNQNNQNIDFQKLKSLEIKLVLEKSISRLDVSAYLNDTLDKNDIDCEISDEWNAYRKLVETFENRIFEYCKLEEVTKIRDGIKSINEYVLCLMLQQNNKKIKKTIEQDLTHLFEEISGECLAAYLGEGAKYKLIDNSDFDFEKFCRDELLEEVESNTNSKFKTSIPRCDLIVWKPIDNRTGKIILLAQCKTGKNWKQGIPVNIKFFQVISSTSTDFLKVYTISDFITNQEMVEYSTEKGLIFDRFRIVSILSKVSNSKLDIIRSKIKGYKLEQYLQDEIA